MAAIQPSIRRPMSRFTTSSNLNKVMRIYSGGKYYLLLINNNNNNTHKKENNNEIYLSTKTIFIFHLKSRRSMEVGKRGENMMEIITILQLNCAEFQSQWQSLLLSPLQNTQKSGKTI